MAKDSSRQIYKPQSDTCKNSVVKTKTRQVLDIFSPALLKIA